MEAGRSINHQQLASGPVRGIPLPCMQHLLYKQLALFSDFLLEKGKQSWRQLSLFY